MRVIYQAALWHHNALSQLLNRTSDTDIRHRSLFAEQTRTGFAVAEVWAAAAALQKPTPCGMVDWPSERMAFVHNGGVPEPPNSSGLFLYDLEWHGLHPDVAPASLRRIFNDIQKLTMYMDKLSNLGEEGIEVYKTVSYLGARSSALRAEVLNLWVDFDSCRAVAKQTGDGIETLDDLVFSASCLAALLFINVIFMYKPHDRSRRSASATTTAIPFMSPSVNRQPLHRLQQTLQEIHWHRLDSEFGLRSTRTENLSLELVTWLCFVAGLVETFEGEGGQTPIHKRVDKMEEGIGCQQFRNCIATYGFGGWKDVELTLKRFLYYSSLMDRYLQKMFEGVVRERYDLDESVAY